MNYYSDYAPLEQTQRFNGRVNISKPSSLEIPSFHKQEKMDNSTFYAEAVQGHFTPNPVSNLFFSCNNIDVLQDGLRYKIYQITNGKHVIGRQSEQDMKVIMRSIFLQYAKNLPQDVVGQVRELNGLVLEWTVKEVLSNLKQYDKYRQDVSTLPMPMARAPLMTSKGSRSLERTTFV